MDIALDQFDLSVYDSSDINLSTPEWLLSKLLLVLEALTDTTPDAIPEEHTELKLRAVLDSLVHEGLKQKAWTKAQLESAVSMPLPRLTEIYVERKGELDLVRFHQQLVVLVPNLDDSTAVGELLSWLNSLVDQARVSRTWILDLSLVDKVPFELFGYLIGLKHTLTRKQIGLDLLWLRRDAVPLELLDAVQKSFNLYKKGAFLLSR